MSILSRPVLPTVERGFVVMVMTVIGAAALSRESVHHPRTAFGLLALLGLAILAFRELAFALSIFIVLTFPDVLPGVLDAGTTLAKPLGLILALAWAAGVVSRLGAARLLPRDHPTIFWVVVAFVGLAGASSVWAVQATQSATELSRYVQVIVLLFVTYTAASTPRGFRGIIWAYMTASVLTAAYALSTGYYVSGRLSGVFDPNYFAAELIPAIVVAYFLLLTTRSTRVRFAVGGILAVDFVAFALTQSRGGLVGLGVALLAAIALGGRVRPRIVAGVLMVAAAGLAFYVEYLPSQLGQRFTHLIHDRATSGRSDQWRIALRIFEQHPFGGVGLGNYKVVVANYASQSIDLHYVYQVTGGSVAHNTYLEIAAELGIGGIILFLALLYLLVRSATTSLSALAGWASDLEFYARGLVAGAIGILTAYVFLSAEYEKQLWLVLGLLACVSALAKQARPSLPAADR